jgi:tRNA dimethylallyltransferase
MPSVNHPDDHQKPGLSDTLIPLVVILGPTAVGKTDIAIELALRFKGEIVSADSRLFYRGMNIGTAKPSTEERRGVPHHLVDIADPDETWSLGVFQKEAHRVIQDIFIRKRLPFLVGGTGQFMRAIIEGWSPPAIEADLRLRQALTQWAQEIGPLTLHAKLALIDAQAASSIDAANVRRTIRALEVIFSTGKRFSVQRQRGSILYNPLLLGLTIPRHELYQRIDARIDGMLASGFIEEVQGLLDEGYSPSLPTFSAIGYSEIIAYLDGRISLDEAIRLMKRRTRIFARRQANWFKKDDPRIHWFQVGDPAVGAMSQVIADWLGKRLE